MASSAFLPVAIFVKVRRIVAGSPPWHLHCASYAHAFCMKLTDRHVGGGVPNAADQSCRAAGRSG